MFFDRLGAGWLAFQSKVRASMRILVVDDEPSVCLLISELMKSEGYSVDTAASIDEASRLLESVSFHLFVLDKNLPDGSGIDLLKRRREAGDETPAVVITGYPSAETVMDALTAGASDYISKPFDDVSLVSKRLESVVSAHVARQLNDRMVKDLAAALEAGGKDQEQVARIAERLFRYKRELAERASVLVVEDNLAVAEVVRRALLDARLAVEVATDLRASTAWVQRGDGPLSALVSVDLTEALPMVSELRRLDPLLEMVVTTGSTDVDLALGAVSAGAADYVVRPFEGIEVLKSRVQRAVARARRRRLYLHLIATLYHEAKRSGSAAMDKLLAVVPDLESPPSEKMPARPQPMSSHVFPEEVDLSDLFGGESELEVSVEDAPPPAPVVSIREESRAAFEDSPVEDDDRRRHKRVEASLEVGFQPITDEGQGLGNLVYSHLRDISAGGMFIVMNQPLPIGTRLSVALDLGWGLDPVELTCEVVRRVSPEESAGGRAGIGVRFADEVQPEVKKLIASLAERIVPV